MGPGGTAPREGGLAAGPAGRYVSPGFLAEHPMAELAVTAFVVLLILGAMKIPALGDAIGRRLRRPRPAPERPLSPPQGARTR